MRGEYSLIDEPHPSRLSHLTVRPTVPLLALMLGGAWLAWPWFALNSVAMGSPTRRRELALVVMGFGVSVVLAGLLVWALQSGRMPLPVARYAVLGVVVWKLGIAYTLHILQSRTFGVYEHFGGPVRNGTPLLVPAFVLRAWWIGSFDDFFYLVLG